MGRRLCLPQLRHWLGGVALGRSLHLSDPNCQVTVRWSKVTREGTQGSAGTVTTTLCSLVSPLLLCLEGSRAFPDGLVGPLLTLNPGTKLVRCYLSLVRWFKREGCREDAQV